MRHVERRQPYAVHQLQGGALMARDYPAEMTALIEESTQGSDWVPALVAEKLIDRLKTDDPDLLNGWLHTLAPQLLTDAISTRERSVRTVTRRRATSRAFATAAESGDPIELGSFAVTFVIDETDTRRRVADMTGTDHRFVATGYAASAKRARMLGAFHQAVAKKVGKQRTAEVMSEAEYDRLFRSITGADAA